MSAPPAAVNPGISSYAPLPSVQNDGGAREFLLQKKWPVPLQEAFISNLIKTPLRYFICDDSGSMCTNDGSLLALDSKGTGRFVNCTRFQELAEALKFHAGLAKAACAPTEFRFLNALSPLRIGFDPYEDSSAFDTFVGQLSQYPSGGTPLCRHIHEIAADIASKANQLRATGQRACLIIATDGESSDGDVAAALRPLKDLPVWVVIRLCTNEDNIVDYWNNIDNVLELNMDVLDDMKGEAKEIHKFNPWLTYGEPVHRLREFGVSIKEFDLLDERALSLTDFQRICKLFYGSALDALPIPEVDLESFLKGVEAESKKHPLTWDPIKKKAAPFINVSAANKAFSKGSKCALM